MTEKEKTLEQAITDLEKSLLDGYHWHDRRSKRLSGKLRSLWLVLYRPRWLALKL